MQFEVIGDITDVEPIAVGKGVRIRKLLVKRFGRGRWRKLKGFGQVRLPDGTIRAAELHWFEAHGIGRKKMNQTVPGLNMSRTKRDRRFAICIKTDDPDLLTPRKIYEVLPDASAEKSEFIRVIDNEGEDYLYPASCFIFVNLPNEVEKALEHVS